MWIWMYAADVKADNLLRKSYALIKLTGVFVKIFVTMHDTVCYINIWKFWCQIDVDRLITTKTNTDFGSSSPHF